jgi:hyperosmotically inducible protein
MMKWMAAVMLAVPSLMLGSNGNAGTQPLEERVRHELTSLAYYSVFDDLSFRVDAGRVTLLGEVTQPVVKEDAERAVKRIPGVVSVSNQIEVLPLSRVDDQIRRNVYYAVYAYAPLERYRLGSQPAIRIIVKNGNVVLTGAVSNEMDRNTVFQRANAVPGVFSVTNRLLVEI